METCGWEMRPDKIIIRQRARPCKVNGRDALFYGFGDRGAKVELRDGTLHEWTLEEVLLLDSKNEFRKEFFDFEEMDKIRENMRKINGPRK